MSINWFPGHMHKATREMRKLLPDIDIVIEVLDARIPYSSQNPVIGQIGRDKLNIKLLNKSDLADPAVTEQWLDYFNGINNTGAMAISCLKADKIPAIAALCRKLARRNSDSLQPITALIAGIPNVGKSTLINLLAGRAIAKTGNEPAVTRAQQRIRIADDLVLFDSPGILWPRFDNQNSACRLAATGAIKDTAISYDDIAFFTAEYLLHAYPDALQQRYQLAQLPASELELLEMIGRRRGCLASGGRVDLEKTGRLLLMEMRSGQLGAISLETPSLMHRELQQVSEQLAQKAAEKEARKALRQQKARKR
ncbi:MAG TPA: ribosome biogenesis GTPase YlqF [Pseudomonadales bacterium]